MRQAAYIFHPASSQYNATTDLEDFMWKRFKNWLLEKEYRRVESWLEREEESLRSEWYARRESLEWEYASIKRQNEHLHNLLTERAMLDPWQPFIIKQEKAN